MYPPQYLSYTVTCNNYTDQQNNEGEITVAVY